MAKKMQIITSYLKKNLILNLLIILLFFSILACAMQFVSQMKFLGQGNYNFMSVVSYVLLLLPRNIYKLAPIIIAVSIAYTAVKLINTKELIAIGAIGVTTRAILSSLSNLSLLIILLFFILGEGLGPWCANIAKNNRINAIASGKAFAASSGIWLYEDNWYINIANIIDSNNIANITKYLVVAGDLKRIEYAKHGSYENNSWLLKDIDWTDLNNHKIASGHTESLIWHSELDSSIVDNFNIIPVRQSLWDLSYSLSADLDIGTNANITKYIFWQRLFYPIALFFMLFFVAAVFFNFTSYNKSKSGFMVAIFVLCYYFAPDYLLSLSFYSVPPIIAALILPAITAVVCYMFIRKNMLN
jgi:lipopolysaccharide export system permease protein